MEKLSIEQKAKAYDELLLKLQKAKVDDNVCDEMYYRVIDNIVPELKESEDEKIRKSIIENLKGNMCRTDGDYDLLNKQITWLEKQGEQKQDPCNNCKDVMLNCHNFPCTKKRAFKQGKSVLEVIKEEPQVYDTEDGEIITYSETDGYKLYQPKFKDGDVLNSPSHHLIWIYKDNEHYYACVNMNYVTENVATDGLINIPSDVRPATKEQREQLEKAMADAGYTFDFDKKELKKVVAPKFKIGDTMRTLQEASNGITSGLPIVVSIDSQYYHCNNELIAIKDQDDYEYPPLNKRQKSVWNEEDKKIIDRIESEFLALYRGDYKNIDFNDVDSLTVLIWVRKIKHLCFQFRWKPSDEQINAIRLARSFVTDDFGANPTLSDTLVELEKQLKKLK